MRERTFLPPATYKCFDSINVPAFEFSEYLFIGDVLLACEMRHFNKFIGGARHRGNDDRYHSHLARGFLHNINHLPERFRRPHRSTPKFEYFRVFSFHVTDAIMLASARQKNPLSLSFHSEANAGYARRQNPGG